LASKKYKGALSEREILIFESVAGDTLERLGYKLDFPCSSHLSFTKEEIKKFEAENAEMKKEAMNAAVPNDITRRQPRQQYLKEIMSRNV